MLKDEQKIIEKWINFLKFAHFCELFKFIIGPKVLVIGPFRCTTYVEPDKNILEPFLHENEVLTIGLTDWSGYSICLHYDQRFHPYSMIYFLIKRQSAIKIIIIGTIWMLNWTELGKKKRTEEGIIRFPLSRSVISHCVRSRVRQSRTFR